MEAKEGFDKVTALKINLYTWCIMGEPWQICYIYSFYTIMKKKIYIFLVLYIIIKYFKIFNNFIF